ncbi:PEBP family protein [Vibrio sp. 10N.261.55.A7]|uniref:PEBP family protein n=1 Tax=Vibrio sp. 10N.261.55.A7 TaxID=1880851 RepID=UPI000C849606|nr:PEBP family protein [Vibrio sp. 10N.261.55.A7]PMJ91601.1 PEBP family protein [Vibrio sp. 10N.261.55.A7]
MTLQSRTFTHSIFFLVLLLVSPFSTASGTAQLVEIQADIWADNWFALYYEDTLIKEDSVSITTERSFNAESFQFSAALPMELSFIIKDFKENDTGLEYIGSRKQQMGDGGFIAQFKQVTNGSILLVSDTNWRCLATHIAPLNKQCEKSRSPSEECKNAITPEPDGWKNNSFDYSDWPEAQQFSKSEVRPKDGYDRITWDKRAQFIWTSDIESDNTILCKVTLSAQE